jgi:hypothetical protein
LLVVRRIGGCGTWGQYLIIDADMVLLNFVLPLWQCCDYVRMVLAGALMECSQIQTPY